MDLFDLDCFYSRQVPILALYSPVIMFSACAFAARQLSLTTRRLPRHTASNRQLRAQPCEEPASSRTQEYDYAWFADAYYDAAISLLRQHTSDVAAQGRRQGSMSQPTQGGDSSTADIYLDNPSPTLSRDKHPPTRLQDEVVVAVTILSNYEFLGGVAPNWSDHLDGTRSFLRLSDEAGFLDFSSSSPVPNPASSGPSRLLRAAFWNFARQDMLSACKPTRFPFFPICVKAYH